jgi:hypothetical protein
LGSALQNLTKFSKLKLRAEVCGNLGFAGLQAEGVDGTKDLTIYMGESKEDESLGFL